MNHKFDELAKGLAQSVTRRQALKKFGVSLAGMALACFGLASKAEADECKPPTGCDPTVSCCCNHCHTVIPKCSPVHTYCENLCGVGCPDRIR